MKEKQKKHYKNIRHLKSGYKVYFTYHKKKYIFGPFKELQEAIECRDKEKFKVISKEKNDPRPNQEWRKTKEYKEWVEQVIERDKKCKICWSEQHLEAHHIKNGNDHPKSRYDLDNGVALCRNCHTNFHCNYKKSFAEKTTEKDWLNFLELVQYFSGIEIKFKGL